MEELNIFQLKEGMVLAKPILHLHTNKLLLNAGETLTKSKINILKRRGIPSAVVLHKHTINIQLIDLIQTEVEEKLNSRITQFAPQKIQATESAKMIQVSLLAQRIASKIVARETILKFCIEMKLVDSIFLYEHSISTCALTLLTAGAMDLDEEEIEKIGIAALLHDLGLIEMPLLLEPKKSQNGKSFVLERDVLSNINTSITLAADESMWQEHTLYGYYLCKERGVDNDYIRKAILHHHENWNGNGFPHGLKGEEIPLGSRIIRVCDIYDRLLRSNKHPRYKAIEALYAGGGYYFDREVVEVFTNSLSVYPLGSVVRLTTGEVGIVVNVKKNQGPRPIVNVYYNRVNKPLTYPKQVDLGVSKTVFIKEIL